MFKMIRLGPFLLQMVEDISLLLHKANKLWTICCSQNNPSLMTCGWEPVLNSEWRLWRPQELSGKEDLWELHSLANALRKTSELIMASIMSLSQSVQHSHACFYECNQIPAHTPMCKAMLWETQRNSGIAGSSHRWRHYLKNLFFKCNYLRMRRVLCDELKSTKLALQWNA